VALCAFDPWVGHLPQVFQQAYSCTHQLFCSKNCEGYSFLSFGTTAYILAINLGAIALAAKACCYHSGHAHVQTNALPLLPRHHANA
jgi:hypothetical protein